MTNGLVLHRSISSHDYGFIIMCEFCEMKNKIMFTITNGQNVIAHIFGLVGISTKLWAVVASSLARIILCKYEDYIM